MKSPAGQLRCANRRGRRGFTILEILATLVLAAIVLPSVMQGISLSLATADYANRQVQAAALAHSKMSELIATGQLQQAVSNGDFGTDWPGFNWSATIEDWDGSTIRQLDVTVAWQQVGRQRNVTMSTLIYSSGSL